MGAKCFLGKRSHCLFIEKPVVFLRIKASGIFNSVLRFLIYKECTFVLLICFKKTISLKTLQIKELNHWELISWRALLMFEGLLQTNNLWCRGNIGRGDYARRLKRRDFHGWYSILILLGKTWKNFITFSRNICIYCKKSSFPPNYLVYILAVSGWVILVLI
jgi:hypothetical protein